MQMQTMLADVDPGSIDSGRTAENPMGGWLT